MQWCHKLPKLKWIVSTGKQASARNLIQSVLQASFKKLDRFENCLVGFKRTTDQTPHQRKGSGKNLFNAYVCSMNEKILIGWGIDISYFLVQDFKWSHLFCWKCWSLPYVLNFKLSLWSFHYVCKKNRICCISCFAPNFLEFTAHAAIKRSSVLLVEKKESPIWIQITWSTPKNHHWQLELRICFPLTNHNRTILNSASIKRPIPYHLLLTSNIKMEIAQKYRFDDSSWNQLTISWKIEKNFKLGSLWWNIPFDPTWIFLAIKVANFVV